MVRRSFRIGLRLGLLIGIGFALVKTVQSRRSPSMPAAPPEPWKPIVDEAPVDEVGEPIEEPAAPDPQPAFGQIHRPEHAPVAESGLEVDVPGLDVPITDPAVAAAAPVKKAAAKKAAGAAKKAADKTEKAVKKAAKASKVAKAAGAMVPPPAWVAAEGGVCPPTHPVKAKVTSRLFHLPGMFAYDRTRADRCYLDAAAAEGEGFTKAKR